MKTILYAFRTNVCCGIIFKGMNGEVLVDPKLLKPCVTCRKEKTTRTKPELQRSTSLDDTDSNSSTVSPSFRSSDFYDNNPLEPVTPPESPPESPHMSEAESLIKLQQCTDNLDFVSDLSISMEC